MALACGVSTSVTSDLNSSIIASETSPPFSLARAFCSEPRWSMAAAAMTPRPSATAFMPASLPGVIFILRLLVSLRDGRPIAMQWTARTRFYHRESEVLHRRPPRARSHERRDVELASRRLPPLPAARRVVGYRGVNSVQQSSSGMIDVSYVPIRCASSVISSL